MKKFARVFAEERSYDRYIKQSGKEQDSRFSKKEIYDVLEPYKNREDIFVSFRDSADHTNINMRNQYDTPHGFYCYPVKDLFENYDMPASRRLDIPFASDRDFMFIIKAKGDAFPLMIDRYGSNEYDDDTYMLMVDFDMNEEDIREASQNARRDIPASKLWNVTRIYADKNPVKWNSILRKLGYDYVVDHGHSVIHYNEPYQAVFLKSSAFTVIDIVKNYSIKERIANRTEGAIKSDNVEKFDEFFRKYFHPNDYKTLALMLAKAVVFKKEKIINFIMSGKYIDWNSNSYFFDLFIKQLYWFIDDGGITDSDIVYVCNFIKRFGEEYNISNYKAFVFYGTIGEIDFGVVVKPKFVKFVTEKIFNNNFDEIVNSNDTSRFIDFVKFRDYETVNKVLEKSFIKKESILMDVIKAIAQKEHRATLLDTITRNSQIKLTAEFVKKLIDKAISENDKNIIDIVIKNPALFGTEFMDNDTLNLMISKPPVDSDFIIKIIERFIYGDQFKNKNFKINIKNVIGMMIHSYNSKPYDLAYKLYVDGKIMADNDGRRIGDNLVISTNIFGKSLNSLILIHAVKIGDISYEKKEIRDILKRIISDGVLKEVESIALKEIEKYE